MPAFGNDHMMTVTSNPVTLRHISIDDLHNYGPGTSKGASLCGASAFKLQVHQETASTSAGPLALVIDLWRKSYRYVLPQFLFLLAKDELRRSLVFK